MANKNDELTLEMAFDIDNTPILKLLDSVKALNTTTLKTAKNMQYRLDGVSIHASKLMNRFYNISVTAQRAKNSVSYFSDIGKKGLERMTNSAAKLETNVQSVDVALRGANNTMNRMSGNMQGAMLRMGMQTMLSASRMDLLAAAALQVNASAQGMRLMSQSLTATNQAATACQPKLAQMAKQAAQLAQQKLANLWQNMKQMPSKQMEGFTVRIERLRQGFLKIKNISIKGVWDGLKQGMTEAYLTVQTGMNQMVSTMKSGLLRAYTGVKVGMGQAVSGIKTGILQAYVAVQAGAGNIANMAKTAVLRVTTSFRTGFAAAATAARTGISTAYVAVAVGLGQAVSAVKTGLGKAVAAVKTAFGRIMTTVKAVMSAVGAVVKSAVGKVFGAMKNGLGKAVGVVKAGFSKALGVVRGFNTGIGQTISKVKNLVPKLKELAKTKLKGLVDGFRSKSSEDGGSTEKMPKEKKNIMGTMLTAKRMMTQLGRHVKNIIGGIGKGFAGVGKGVWKLAGMASKQGKGKNLEADVSGMKQQFSELGGNVGALFLPDISGGIQQVTAFGSELNSVLADGIQEGDASKITDIITRMIGSIGDILPSLVSKFVELFSGIGNALITALPTVLNSLIAGISTIVPMILGLLQQLLPQLLTAAMSVLEAIMNGILGMLPQLVSLLNSMVQALVAALPGLLTSFISVIMGVIQGLLDILQQNGPQLVLVIMDGLGQIITGLLGMLPQLVGTAVMLLTAVIQGITQQIPILIPAIMNALTGIVTSLAQMLPLLLQAGLDLLMALVQGIIDNLPLLIDSVMQMVQALLGFILQSLPVIIQAGMQLLMALIQGIITNLPLLVNGVVQLIQMFVGYITEALPMIIMGGIQLLMALVQGVLDNLPMLIDAAFQIIIALGMGLLEAIPQLIGMIPQVIGALIDMILSTNWLEVGWNILKSIFSGIFEGVKKLGGSICKIFKNLFSKGGKDSGEAFTENLAMGMEDTQSLAIDTASSTSTAIQEQFLTSDEIMEKYGSNKTTGGMNSTLGIKDEVEEAYGISQTELEKLGINGKEKLDQGVKASDLLPEVELKKAEIAAKDALRTDKLTAAKYGIDANPELAGSLTKDELAVLAATLRAMEAGEKGLKIEAAIAEKVGEDTLKSLDIGINHSTDSFVEGISSATKDLVDSFQTGISGSSAVNGAQGTVTGNTITAGTTSMTDALGSNNGLAPALNTAGSIAKNVIEGVQQTVPTPQKVDIDMQLMDEEFRAALTALSSFVQTTVVLFTTAFILGFQRIPPIVRTAMLAVRSTIMGVSLFSTGMSIVAGLKNGMLNMLPALKQTAAMIATIIKLTVDTKLEVGSPSKVMFQTGQFVGQGAALGIQSTLPKVQAAASLLGQTAEDTPLSGNYTPESSIVSRIGSQRTENNTYSPQFNLSIQGDNDRQMERKVKNWIRQAMNDTFASMGRKAPRLQEV